MALTRGFNHVATLTPDLDRYVEFYEDVFGARVVATMPAGGDHPPMAVLHMGADCELNVFEVADDSIVGDRTRMGARGRIDHFALAVETVADLEAVRDRLVGRGASPGDITDFGSVLSVFFRDPDGTELEVACHKPGVEFDAVVEPVEMTPPARMGDAPT